MGQEREQGLTRRQAIGAGIAGAATLGVATLAAGALAPGGGAASPASGSAPEPTSRTSTGRVPVAYIPHGGGPWPFVDIGIPAAEVDALLGYLKGLPALAATRPKSLLIVSAHWEETVPTVMTNERPPILYDYYGFPPAAYSIAWPAPGAPAVAARVRELLGAAGIETAVDAARGFDHGAFIPFKVAYPDAEIPTLQLSLQAGLDPAAHLAIGRAIAPLRDEGVFIVGSGMSYHNMRGFFGSAGSSDAAQFDDWLRDAVTEEPGERNRRLTAWAQAPSARAAHPREEHLLPLMVVAGAAGLDRGTVGFTGTMGGKRISAFHFA